MVELGILMRFISRIQENYALYLLRTTGTALVCMLANIVIAFSASKVVSEIAYCVYFAAIDWMILALSGFCAIYTEHYRIVKYFFLKIQLFYVILIVH